MPQTKSITEIEIIQQLKISCQIPTVLQDIYIRKLVINQAQAEGIELNADELQQAADSFRLQHHLWSSEATFAWLTKHNLSTEDFEELVRSKALAAKLAQHMFGNRVESYFYEHQLEYNKAVIYEIVLDNFDLAIELFYGVQEQEFSFWDLTDRYIEDVELKRAKGYRGLLSRNELKPEISAVVFAAKPPQLLKPFLSEKHTHLIFVGDIIRPKLNDQLKYQIVCDLFTQWQEQQLEDIILSLAES